MKRITLAKIILSLTAIVLVFAAFEIYSRVQATKKNREVVLPFYQQDPLIVQSLIPSQKTQLKSRQPGEFDVEITTTSQGFRDIRDYEIPKPKNTFRILMLGDSFTLGWGVQISETFSKHLEKLLAEKIKNKKIEVINAGYANGFTWDEAYLFTKARGLSYEPDLIIENVWIGNDIREIGEHEYPEVDQHGLPQKIISKTIKVEEGFLKEKPKPRRITGIFGTLNQLICDNLEFCRLSIRPAFDRYIVWPLTGRKPTSRFTGFLKNELSAQDVANWQIGQKELAAISSLAQKEHTKFMITQIPVKEEIYDRYKILEGESINTTRIRDFAEESHIVYCDLSQKLKEKPKESYFRFDSHLTPTGHYLAAHAIENCIFANGLL